MQYKKYIFLPLIFFCLIFSGCELSSLDIKDERIDQEIFGGGDAEEIIEDEMCNLPYDLAFYRSTKRDKNFLLFDTNSKNVIYLSHGPNAKRKTVTNYREGIYSGDINSEFDVSITWSSDNTNTTHYKRNGKKIESYFSDGSVNSTYSVCDVSDAEKYLKETDYFD